MIRTTMARRVGLPLAVAALALLTACAGPAYREAYTVYEAPRSVRPIDAAQGTVSEIDLIPVARRPSGAGAVLGAVIGGVIGNQFGRGGGRVAATGVGVMAGAVAGNAVEIGRNGQVNEIYRVSVRFGDGSVRAYDFFRIDDLRVGDRVRWENGQLYRA